MQTKVQAAQSFSRPVDESTAMDEQRDQTRLLLSGDEALDDDSVEVKRSRRPRGHFGRTLVYCDICQQHVVGRYHHSRWLDCCISDVNVGFFLFGCGLGLFGLLFGSNLALTSICHPFYLFSVFGVKILLPDDCSDVFDQYKWDILIHSFAVSNFHNQIIIQFRFRSQHGFVIRRRHICDDHRHLRPPRVHSTNLSDSGTEDRVEAQLPVPASVHLLLSAIEWQTYSI